MARLGRPPIPIKIDREFVATYMPVDEVREVYRFAEEQGRSVSSVLRDSVRLYMDAVQLLDPATKAGAGA